MTNERLHALPPIHPRDAQPSTLSHVPDIHRHNDAAVDHVSRVTRPTADVPRSRGKVTLLGTGPGEIDLLTLRAARVLAVADVLLLDDLANPEIVTLAPQARVIRVGKRGGCRSTPQAFIERLMCRYARRGCHVVRAKGGDALLFGRAGEEIQALRRADIAVEIVNGISSGFAAAAGLGISLTHRAHCDGVTFVTAHKQDHDEPDWRALAASNTTLAIYMGMHRIHRICAALAEHLPASTPAAVVEWAGTIHERRCLGTLTDIAERASDAGLQSPAVILVGQAIGMAAADAQAKTESDIPHVEAQASAA